MEKTSCRHHTHQLWHDCRLHIRPYKYYDYSLWYLNTRYSLRALSLVYLLIICMWIIQRSKQGLNRKNISFFFPLIILGLAMKSNGRVWWKPKLQRPRTHRYHETAHQEAWTCNQQVHQDRNTSGPRKACQSLQKHPEGALLWLYFSVDYRWFKFWVMCIYWNMWQTCRSPNCGKCSSTIGLDCKCFENHTTFSSLQYRCSLLFMIR